MLLLSWLTVFIFSDIQAKQPHLMACGAIEAPRPPYGSIDDCTEQQTGSRYHLVEKAWSEMGVKVCYSSPKKIVPGTYRGLIEDFNPKLISWIVARGLKC